MGQGRGDLVSRGPLVTKRPGRMLQLGTDACQSFPSMWFRHPPHPLPEPGPAAGPSVAPPTKWLRGWAPSGQPWGTLGGRRRKKRSLFFP